MTEVLSLAERTHIIVTQAKSLVRKESNVKHLSNANLEILTSIDSESMPGGQEMLDEILSEASRRLIVSEARSLIHEELDVRQLNNGDLEIVASLDPKSMPGGYDMFDKLTKEVVRRQENATSNN